MWFCQHVFTYVIKRSNKVQLTPHKLRSLSESGQLAQQRKGKEDVQNEKKRQHSADLKEAQDRIGEADEKMAQAASQGEREARVCVLRGGLHFERGFYTN